MREFYAARRNMNGLGDSDHDKRFFPSGAIFFFALLVLFYAALWIPLAWSVGTASQSDIDTLLESIGFQYGKAGTEFSHPNLLIFLDSNLRIAEWIYGTDYSGRDVDLALKISAGQSDWVGEHSEWLYAILLFAGSLLCVALAYYVVQLIVLRRATRKAAVN